MGIVVLATLPGDGDGAAAAVGQLRAATSVFLVTTALAIAASLFARGRAPRPA